MTDSACSPSDPDILVHAEKVIRVVSPLDVGQPIIVCPIRTTDTPGFLFGHVVHVDRSGRVWRECVGQVARPGYARVIEQRIGPAGMNAHNKLYAAARERRCVRFKSVNPAADLCSYDSTIV